MRINTLNNKIITGDCELVLKKVPSNSIDLIVTSPPYADSRSKIYQGVNPDKYVQWFLPKSKEFLRVLKPSGTFILNIKERVVDGQRHTFVLELILELQKQGWLWTEEFIWHKKNSYPGKWPNRFRDAWERCLQFNKGKNPQIFQDEVMVQIGNWAEKRFRNLKDYDLRREESRVSSGFGRKVSNWKERKKVYPSNVLHIATETGNRNHSAVFPIEIPTWFIKLFTAKNNIILDPFMGSGTTAVAAKRLGRKYIGIEISKEFCKVAENRIKVEC